MPLRATPQPGQLSLFDVEQALAAAEDAWLDLEERAP